ncbi:MAG TPA: hypothetical protein VG942_13755 [Hyphomonadaceae bacterium]|nr:hypothetical protein [Hyphomonadaceae bacterium]
MLELRDVSRSLGGDPILDRTSLDFPSDSPTAVLGLGPQAREIFLRLLSGAEKPQSGRIKLAGRDIAQVKREKHRIVRISGAGLKPSGQRVGKLIGASAAARVRLNGKLDAQVNALDLDQRVRLAIAVAVEEGAGLILIDSPASGLELDPRQRFIADLKTMLSGTGAVVVLAAGMADEARGLDGYAVVLGRGRVAQQGAAAEVFGHPANLTVALATSFPALNTLPMLSRDGRGVLADGSTFQPPQEMSLPEDTRCTLAFRPDDTTLERQDERCLRFVARADREEKQAGRRFLRIGFGGASWLTPLTAEAPRPGMVVNLFVERSRLMLFGADGRAIV